MNKRGTLVILGILVVAVAAASFAVYYQYRAQHHAMDLWGVTSARLIAESPEVELLTLGEETDPELEPAESEERTRVESGNRAWMVAAAKDAKTAKGIANVRRALIMDTTYDWDVAEPVEEPAWQYAMAFTDGKNWATVLFDFDTRRVALTGSRKSGQLNQMASDDLKLFFKEQLDDAPPPAAAGDPPVDQPEKTSSESPPSDATAEPVDK